MILPTAGSLVQVLGALRTSGQAAVGIKVPDRGWAQGRNTACLPELALEKGGLFLIHPSIGGTISSQSSRLGVRSVLL